MLKMNPTDYPIPLLELHLNPNIKKRIPVPKKMETVVCNESRADEKVDGPEGAGDDGPNLGDQEVVTGDSAVESVAVT